jgi:sugar-specific transcriptional regulator TrmB
MAPCVENRAFIEQLTRLGLTSYEAKAYLGLMRRDSATAAQVARLSGVPRQRIYDVLASLVERGLASTRPGSAVKYAATPPEHAVGGLIARQREELEARGAMAKQMIEQLVPAFLAGQEHTDPLEYIEVLRDARAINERFGELQAGTKTEILVFTKPPYATPAQENVEGLTVAKQHEARSIYEFSAFDDPAFVEGVRRFIEAGEEARFVPELPLKLVIIDETIVMFGMEDPVAGRSELTIVVIEHPSLAKVLKVAFMAIWNEALTLDEAHERFVTLRKKTA